MDASKIMNEWKCWVLCWLLRLIEPELLWQEFYVTTTMLPTSAAFQVIATCHLGILAENAVKFELQN